jgi:hypothetical protein
MAFENARRFFSGGAKMPKDRGEGGDDMGVASTSHGIERTLQPANEIDSISRSIGPFDDAIERRISSESSPHFFSYPIELTFYKLRANGEANVRLEDGGAVRWGNSNPGSKLVGISLSASPRGALLTLNSFVVNSHNVSLVTNASCPEIHVRLYAHTLEESFCGQVDLPPDATVTIESTMDRTTIAERGISSFVLMLR